MSANKRKWDNYCQTSFNNLKVKLSTAPILVPFTSKYPLVVTTDASKDFIGATLEMFNKENKIIGVVAYLSKKLHTNELNWPIREKELYAIIFALQKWKHYLLGDRFTIRTDHQTLQYIKTGKTENARLIRWWDLLANYDFQIIYIKGKLNHTDGLSRPPNQVLAYLNTVSIQLPTDQFQKIKEEYPEDPFFSRIYDQLSNTNQTTPTDLRTIIKKFHLDQGLIYYKLTPNTHKRLAIAIGETRSTLLQIHHDSATATRPGPYRTLQRLFSN